MILQSFSSVLLVAGGSGITHSLGIAHDLIYKASKPPFNVRARSINIVWATRTREAVEGLLPTFEKLIECGHKAEQESPYGTTLRIHVYVTRQLAPRPQRIGSIIPPHHDLQNVVDLNESKMSVAPEGLTESGVQILLGVRPDLDAILAETVDLTATLETGNSRGGLSRDVKPQGIAVAICGPDALVVSAREAVRGMAQSKVSKVGGIELLEESFCH
jgi:ferric-chelate reductase